MRELFSLDPDVAHLNHGSFGSVPIRVQQEQQQIRDEIERNPMAMYGRDVTARVADARGRLADFLGADPAGCAFVANATSATAVVLNSIGFAEGDEVIVTDHLYNAVDSALQRLRHSLGIVVTRVAVGLDASDAEIVASLLAAVRPGRTRLMILDHVASATAKLFPVADVAAALRGSAVALYADAAHSPGMVPDPVDELGADFWVGNLHKWGYAPRGTALLHVAPAWRDRLVPVIVSRGDLEGYPANVERQGTRDISGWLAAPTGTDLLTELGFDECRRHNAELAATGQDIVAGTLHVRDRPDPGHGVSMRVIPLPRGVAATQAAADALRDRIAIELRAEVNINAWNGVGLLRLSAQIYNTPDEYARLADGLRKLL